MTIALLREYEPRLPVDFDDVACALSDAQAEAHDAAIALERALSALHTSDPVEAASKLATAVESLREALKQVETCAEPMMGWADRASGDW
jgi:hypothetical protein